MSIKQLTLDGMVHCATKRSEREGELLITPRVAKDIAEKHAAAEANRLIDLLVEGDYTMGYFTGSKDKENLLINCGFNTKES